MRQLFDNKDIIEVILPGKIPNPVWILRIIHLNTLDICLRRGGIHAPNFQPSDGQSYTRIDDATVNSSRSVTTIPCGPQGSIHDYVPFYFGPLSPMLYRLHNNNVLGHTTGQQDIIYLVTSVQHVQTQSLRYVFSDGHGLARFTSWFDDLNQLSQVDWNVVNQRYWADTLEDPDKKRRKQAEFLVYQFIPWNTILGIVVQNLNNQNRVQAILNQYGPQLQVKVDPNCFY